MKIGTIGDRTSGGASATPNAEADHAERPRAGRVQRVAADRLHAVEQIHAAVPEPEVVALLGGERREMRRLEHELVRRTIGDALAPLTSAPRDRGTGDDASRLLRGTGDV